MNYLLRSIKNYWCETCQTTRAQLNISENYIQKKCDMCRGGWSTGHINAQQFRSRVTNFDRNSHSSKHRQLILLLFNRNPVDTVISGFNYHKNCTEWWTRVPIINMKYRNDYCTKMHMITEKK